MEHTTDLFVTCAPGLEPILVDELVELGFAQSATGFAGVYVKDSSPQAIYKINYCSRIASRVLLPISRFKCWDRNALYKAISQIDWTHYLKPHYTFAIDANVHHPRLRHSLFAALVVKDAICDQLRDKWGVRPNVDVQNPDVQLNLFIHDNKAVISLDTSGMPLNKRGYRQAATEAVLKETLAAALLRMTTFNDQDIVCDPCCGAGTLLIEAALIASKIPPGFLRKTWGFMQMPDFSQAEWLKVKLEADQHRRELPKGHFYGIDINKNAIVSAKANLRAAGLQHVVELIQADFRSTQLPVQPTLMITDPPFGKRTGEIEQLRFLYKDLGDFMKNQMAKPSTAYVITGNAELAKSIGLAAKRRIPIDNSGVASTFLEFPIW